MGSRVKAGASDDAIAYEVDITPGGLRERLAESDKGFMVATRQGTQFFVTEATVIEPLDE
jgi:hypothetical protein